MFALLAALILAIGTWLFFPRICAVLDEPPIPPSAAAEGTPLLSRSQCLAPENDGPDLSSTAGEETADTRIREGAGRGGHTTGENVEEPEQPNILSTEYSRVADGTRLPLLAGNEACGTQPCENKCSTDEDEVKSVPTDVVPVDETPPTLPNEYSQGRDIQEPRLSPKEDPVSTDLRGGEDYDGRLEIRASSEDGETDSEEDELYTSSSESAIYQGTVELELSARAGDQAAIAHVHESGSSAEVLKAAVLTDEERQVLSLSCRCSRPVHEEELGLPEGRKNVIACLLRNAHNRSVDEAQLQLEKDEERAKQWELAAGRAGVELEQRQVGIVYADEKAMDDVKVDVPRQMKYVGTRPAIPSSLADTPCADLGVDGMLQHLNKLLRTMYTLDRPGLSSVLQSYAGRGFDFGLAYGHLRIWWFEDFTHLQEMMREWEAADKKRRDEAVDGAYIVDRFLPPRRAWDLYSNRVLPWWVFREWDSDRRKWQEMETVDAVSHSWVHPTDRQRVWTLINGYEWPVPIPSDTTLDQIRVELLNVGRELIWLDVLCLWQDGVLRDNAARLQEWELDVPTIGNIYQSRAPNSVVVYFNGLGRPFRIGNLKNERHWLNRAWTLQEFNKDGIIGGLVHGSSAPFPPSNHKQDEILKDPNTMRFYQQLQVASNNRSVGSAAPNDLVFSVLAAMCPRHASHIVDKVGGITHILAKDRIPTYTRSDKDSAIEDAWNLLIAAMDDHHRADLFFFYPVPGKLNGELYAWYPSWGQITAHVPLVPSLKLSELLTYNEGQFYCRGWLIENCQIQGFARPSSDGSCRRGKMHFLHAGVKHLFSAVAHHQKPIADDERYALKGAGAQNGDVVVWVVGRLHYGKLFEKLSVLRTEDSDELKEIQELRLTMRFDRLPAAPGAAIAHVHESWSSAAVVEETVSADEELQVLSCRCSEPIREEELRLPEEVWENVITCLLGNEYNRSVETAQTQLERYEKERARQWEEAAKAAGVEERQQVGIVYADEKAMDDVRVEVPRQLKYVGTSPAIPPSLADTLCADLGVDGMIQYLNHFLRTTYTHDRPGLSFVLQSYIQRGFDFGLAYGHLRLWWFEDFTHLQEMMREREAEDKVRRDWAVDGAYIVDRSLSPRRAWDLYSNRVLPWWVFRKWDRFGQKWERMNMVDAVSHSWVHPDDRQSVWTPINGGKWPVPIPKDVTLDRVRVELLNVGVEIVWLDVLCLWQDGVPEDDEARLKEWELDVPTIGGVYQSLLANTVVTYFNGLGRPFRVGNLDDERHWLNRAWTLQEFNKESIIGGLVPGSFPPPMVNNQVNSDPNVVRFYHRLQTASSNVSMHLRIVLSVLAAMGPRHAAHVVDKVGGITHVLTMGRIPKYIRSNESSAAENAWDLLISVMDNNNLADLFFLYPARGAGKSAWCPSWEQVNGPLPPVPPFTLWGSLRYHEEEDRFKCQGWLIEKCQIKGFMNPNPGGRCRTGTLRVVHDGAEHSFTVTAHHQVPISDGSYALVGDRSYDGPDVVVWAIGTFSSDKRFEKLSVLRTEDKGDLDVMFNLGLIGQRDPNHARRREGRQLDKIDLL